jgi:hypothetical protein
MRIKKKTKKMIVKASKAIKSIHIESKNKKNDCETIKIIQTTRSISKSK